MAFFVGGRLVFGKRATKYSTVLDPDISGLLRLMLQPSGATWRRTKGDEMKHLKILGMAVVAVAALMAFVGASTASADVLCTENTTTECAAGKRVTVIELSAVGFYVAYTTAGETLVTCTSSSMKGEDTEGSATHEPGGAVSSISWGGCNHTVVTKALGRVSIETKETAGGVHDNTVVSSGITWTTELFGVSCEYTTGAGTSLGDLTTGANATLHINTILIKDAGSFLCPTSVRWEETMQITNHNAVWMATK